MLCVQVLRDQRHLWCQHFRGDSWICAFSICTVFSMKPIAWWVNTGRFIASGVCFYPYLKFKDIKLFKRCISFVFSLHLVVLQHVQGIHTEVTLATLLSFSLGICWVPTCAPRPGPCGSSCTPAWVSRFRCCFFSQKLTVWEGQASSSWALLGDMVWGIAI